MRISVGSIVSVLRSTPTRDDSLPDNLSGKKDLDSSKTYSHIEPFTIVYSVGPSNVEHKSIIYARTLYDAYLKLVSQLETESVTLLSLNGKVIDCNSLGNFVNTTA